MENTIKQTIEARKNAIFSSYSITDKKLLNKIDDLFKRINEFGEKFDDINKFEMEFAKNPLNNEYTNIFVELAKKEIDDNSPSVTEMAAERVGNSIKNRIIPSRAVIADERDKALRNIPIIGDAINISQKIDLFNKFRKNKQ